jgi:NAD(P)-dependent dehydrogenase (short-subunit alcohol dehydrogenase family)
MRVCRLLSVILLIFAGPLVVASDAAVVAQDDPTTVLITGANRGIGFEFAKQLAARGWRVIATTRNPEQAIELQSLAEEYPAVSIARLDVTVPQEISDLAQRYGEQPIDLLLLNAAMGPQQPTATAPLRRQNFDVSLAYFETNAIGPMRVAQAFWDNVKSSAGKQVIALSSDSGSFVAGSQLPILYHYKASKAALNMYMHTLSFEAAKRGVIVVMLHPGMVATGPETSRLPGAMPTEESVRMMLDVIDGLTPAANGSFIDYRGELMPW